jgi:hypothetical protein
MDETRKTFAARPGAQLEVAVERAGLDVQGWDREEIEVTLSGGEAAGDRCKAWEGVRIDASPSGDSLRLRAGDALGSAFSLAIRTPRRSDLRITAGRSRAALAGLEGNVELLLGHGQIEGRDLRGATRLRMSRGECRLLGWRGVLDVETEQGSVFVDAAELWGESRVETAGGSIEIHVPAAQGLSIRTRHDRPWRRIRFQAVLGDGAAELFAHTRRGEISLYRGDKWVGTLVRGGEVRWRRWRRESPGPGWWIDKLVERLQHLR